MKQQKVFWLITGIMVGLFLIFFAWPTTVAAADGVTPDSGLMTSFLPAPYPDYDCRIPYFSLEEDKLPTTIHVMNTDTFSNTITAYFWETSGVHLRSHLLLTLLPCQRWGAPLFLLT